MDSFGVFIISIQIFKGVDSQQKEQEPPWCQREILQISSSLAQQ
jgi:hypothetical protein